MRHTIQRPTTGYSLSLQGESIFNCIASGFKPLPRQAAFGARPSPTGPFELLNTVIYQQTLGLLVDLTGWLLLLYAFLKGVFFSPIWYTKEQAACAFS